MDCYVRLERNNIKELIDEVERSEVMFLLVGVGVSTAWRAGLDLRFGVVHQQIPRQRGALPLHQAQYAALQQAEPAEHCVRSAEGICFPGTERLSLLFSMLLHI